MPEPKKGETERDFLSRCIPMLIHEGREKSQSIAICFSVYRRKGDFPSPKPENSGKKSNPGHNNPGHKSSNSSNSYRKKLSRSDKIRILNYF